MERFESLFLSLVFFIFFPIHTIIAKYLQASSTLCAQLKKAEKKLLHLQFSPGLLNCGGHFPLQPRRHLYLFDSFFYLFFLLALGLTSSLPSSSSHKTRLISPTGPIILIQYSGQLGKLHQQKIKTMRVQATRKFLLYNSFYRKKHGQYFLVIIVKQITQSPRKLYGSPG